MKVNGQQIVTDITIQFNEILSLSYFNKRKEKKKLMFGYVLAIWYSENVLILLTVKKRDNQKRSVA